MSGPPPLGPMTTGSASRYDATLLLDALQRLAVERLLPSLDRALGKADDYLFDRSQKGSDDIGLTALQDLRRSRASILQRFEANLLSRFRALRDPCGGSEFEKPVTLSLLSEEALEEQLAHEQLSDALGRMHAPALELLEARVAHMLGRIAGNAQDNPLGPRFVAGALQQALSNLGLPVSVRIVLSKWFERDLAGTLAALYERANALLADAGVLPELRASAKAMAEAKVAKAAGQAQQAQAAAAGVEVAPADQALFANMLGLMQSWRGGSGPSLPGNDASRQALRTSELMALLSLMQREQPARLARCAGASGIALAEELRRELLGGARRLGMDPHDVRLDGHDEDAVDLVAMLFDVLLDGRDFGSGIREKIGCMLVPYVKVAVRDRRMFLLKDHPARRLLNTVAEACEGNHGEGPQERELLTRVDATIDRLVAEFNEDMAIFEVLEQELRGFVGQHRKRMELVEKRAAETQRGRERLHSARAAACEDVRRQREGRVLPASVDQFLEQHVVHHLTQVALRDGQGAPRYGSALLAINELLIACDRAVKGQAPAGSPLSIEQLAPILASSGIEGAGVAQAQVVLDDAIAQLAAGVEAASIDTRLPEQPAVVAQTLRDEPVLELVGGTDTLDYDALTLGRVHELQIGQWLDLVSREGSRPEPAKVSWISPVSGRLLLVNRRGIRVLVASREELAALAKLGRLVLREADTAFEDAMYQVVGRLRSETPGS